MWLRRFKLDSKCEALHKEPVGVDIVGAAPVLFALQKRRLNELLMPGAGCPKYEMIKTRGTKSR